MVISVMSDLEMDVLDELGSSLKFLANEFRPVISDGRRGQRGGGVFSFHMRTCLHFVQGNLTGAMYREDILQLIVVPDSSSHRPRSDAAGLIDDDGTPSTGLALSVTTSSGIRSPG